MALEKTLESPLDCKEIKPVNPKGISPEYSFEGLMEAEAPIFWPPDAKSPLIRKKALMLGKIEGRRRGRLRPTWLDGITNTKHEFEQAPGDGEGQGSLAC